MDDAVKILRSLPLEAFETPRPDDAWVRCSLANASDEILIQSVAAAITPPKIQINSSFLLHAPLELLARAWLLQKLPPRRRHDVRRRIAEIAVRYASEGPEIESTLRDYSSIDHALRELSAALRAGDPDTVDSAFLFLPPHISVKRLRATLAGQILPSLAAAGHAPILLMMLSGAVGHFPRIGALLRSPLRALALEADLRLTWMDSVASTEDATPDLFARLAALPSRVAVSSTSIAPTMLGVERKGYATRVLASATSGVPASDAERVLLRVAALSMLQDDPAHAPYGWSHCLTIPQAILSLADVASDVTRVVRIAATYVLGFRATLGSTLLRGPYIAERRADNAVLQGDPAEAAAVVIHAKDDQWRSIRAQLIERAAAHADAHLAKYTMACFIAADRDQTESSLYRAAAAYLGAWWDRR